MRHLSIRQMAAGLATIVALGGFATAASGAAPSGKTDAQMPPAARQAPTMTGPSAISKAGLPAGARQRLASQDGVCDVGDVCLYYLSNFVGSRYDTAHNDGNLWNNRFNTVGLGQWSRVASNAESVWNRDPRTTMWVCTGLNSTGSCGSVAPNSFGNLSATFKNRVQSITWADSIN